MPPETKALEDFVDNFKDKDTNNDKEIQKFKDNAFDKLRRVTYDILPEESKDFKKISQLRVQQFEQEDEKNRQRKLRENAIQA